MEERRLNVKIKFKKEMYVPAGMYCNDCSRIEDKRNQPPYCGEFYETLRYAEGCTMRFVKCDNCLLKCAASLREGCNGT